jgi:restriction system protein
MARKEENILNLLSNFPWWVSVLFGICVYVGLRFVIPSITFTNPFYKGMAQAAPRYALISLIFLLPAAASAIVTTRKRRLLDRQSGIESIRLLSWKEFEELLAESYRRQGYTVRENSSSGPDGGIDLQIRKDGNLYLVQCKQWRSMKVGVKVVREMFGLMTAQGANGVIIVTSGMFTQEAKNFAMGKSIDLVEGNQLAALVRNIQATPTHMMMEEEKPQSAKQCPQCGGNLVVREAKRGEHAGSKFWGCSSFPKCRYTEKFNS